MCLCTLFTSTQRHHIHSRSTIAHVCKPGHSHIDTHADRQTNTHTHTHTHTPTLLLLVSISMSPSLCPHPSLRAQKCCGQRLLLREGTLALGEDRSICNLPVLLMAARG